MAIWTRKQFDAVGITQSPTGPYLRSVQNQFGGTVMLMIDISGSMGGARIVNAAAGARLFVEEAVAAHYAVGVMLWNDQVVDVCSPNKDGQSALRILGPLSHAHGGNSLIQPLEECDMILRDFSGDRVVALFGDGDITPKDAVLAKVAEMKSNGIRFVTRGLGHHAAQEFAEISDERSESVLVQSVEQLSTSIASMASSLNQRADSDRAI